MYSFKVTKNVKVPGTSRLVSLAREMFKTTYNLSRWNDETFDTHRRWVKLAYMVDNGLLEGMSSEKAG